MGEPDLTIQSVRNETTEEDIFVIPEFEEVDNSFNMFWICPPIFALLAIMLSITLIRLMERTEEDTPEGEENGDGDEESEG
jgi:heme/copper-type cytochrome/quinol oxidase subunit 2